MLMPRMSGIDMLRALRAREGDGPHAPRLILSNSSTSAAATSLIV
jgi:CheY-like chemotaxis protein